MTQPEQAVYPGRESAVVRITNRMTVFLLTKAFELMAGPGEEKPTPKTASSVGRIALTH